MLKFNLGSHTKKYAHDGSYNINTTSDFGSFQPICSQYLAPNDTYIIREFKQLVRNAVMPNPTFGFIKCVNNFRFVPMREIFPQFEALLAGKDIHSYLVNYKPTKVPTISNSYLVFMLGLFYGKLNFQGYRAEKTKALHISPNSLIKMTLTNSIPSSWDLYLKFFKNKGMKFDDKYDVFKSKYTLRSGDFIDTTISYSNCDFMLTMDDNKILYIRLSNAGKRLFKIFKGLGYSLDACNMNPVSVLPLFAYYKAWFDKYYPTRFKGWQNTACFELINTIFEANLQDLTTLDTKENNTYHSLLINFFEELANTWYVFPDDYFSANQTSPLENVAGDITLGLKSGSSSAETPSPYGKQSVPNIDNKTDLSLINIQTLQRVTRFLNKNSLVGNRIKEWVRVHYGSAKVSELFGDSNDIATFITDVQLDDMYSSADTLTKDGTQGEPLGKRGGRGDGFSGENSFKFKASEFGFLIGFTAVYPVSYYFQGDDPQLYMTSRYTFPTAEFDSLGYELTPLAQIIDNNGINIDNLDNTTNKSFGFLPRYSQFKYKKNLINGDMRLHSTKDSFLSFHLDRWIQRKEIIVDSDKNLLVIRNDIPDAGTEWRYISKYPQLGYFNRIFLNSGNSSPEDDTLSRADDNFTIQCVVSAKFVNSLKPLSNSFDTFEEDTDNSTTSVSNV